MEVNRLREAISLGSKAYKLCINDSIHLVDIDKIIKESETQLSDIAKKFDSLKELTYKHEAGVLKINDKI